MNKFVMWKEKWLQLWKSSEDGRGAFVDFIRNAGAYIQKVAAWIWRLRGVILSVPVAFVAVHLALKNYATLPENVGINLLETGEYATTISRDLAVVFPLGLTAVCLVMVLLSRKTLYPWLISVFTLILPIFVALLNGLFPV